MSDLSQYEKDMIIDCLASELEAVEEHRGSLGENVANVRKEEINNIIGKLDDGIGWVDTRGKVDDLLNRHAEEVLKTAESMFHSGAVDVGSYRGTDWGLAKVLTTAALERHCGDFYPRNMDGERLFIKDIKNLMHF